MAEPPALKWSRLFPDGEHRFQMALRRTTPDEFWPARTPADALRAERRRWLEHNASVYVMGALDSPEVLEAQDWMSRSAGLMATPTSALEAAESLEPDWVVLAGESFPGFPVLGGALIFPSSWALAEKVGRPIAEVHGVVPTLQAGLGRPIETFLRRLEPGADWERVNWGLSADGKLNHHPSQTGPGLSAEITLDATWLRLETQYFARLPQSRGLIFGIRMETFRLDALAGDPGFARPLARTLRTMDHAVAAYKGLTACRDGLASQLEATAAAD